MHYKYNSRIKYIRFQTFTQTNKWTHTHTYTVHTQRSNDHFPGGPWSANCLFFFSICFYFFLFHLLFFPLNFHGHSPPSSITSLIKTMLDQISIIFTSNVPGPRPGTFTPAQRPGRYHGCSVLRYLRPRNLAASFAAATGAAGVTAAFAGANQRAAAAHARPINTLGDDQHFCMRTNTICITLRCLHVQNTKLNLHFSITKLIGSNINNSL